MVFGELALPALERRTSAQCHADGGNTTDFADHRGGLRSGDIAGRAGRKKFATVPVAMLKLDKAAPLPMNVPATTLFEVRQLQRPCACRTTRRSAACLQGSPHSCWRGPSRRR